MQPRRHEGTKITEEECCFVSSWLRGYWLRWLLCGACLWLPICLRAEIIDRVLAVVGGATITQSDVTAAVELGLVTPRGTGEPAAGALTQLVERQLMLMEVERYLPPEPPETAVAARLQAVRDRFPTAAAYQATLRRSGVDDTRLRQSVRDDLRIEAYLDQRFSVPPLTAERRAMLISEWVGGLRRRADITFLDVARQ